MLKRRIDHQALHHMRGKQAPPAKDEIRQGNQPLEKKGCDRLHDRVHLVLRRDDLNKGSSPMIQNE
jgi:hypothetical protein